jgi:hypothetical protein
MIPSEKTTGGRVFSDIVLDVASMKSVLLSVGEGDC